MTASPIKPALRIRTRIAVAATVLLVLCTASACSKTVATNGAGGLNGVAASASPSSGSTPAPTPTKPVATATPKPPPSPAPSTSKPIIVIPILTAPPIIKVTLGDCIHFDPSTAAIVNKGPDGFTITASGESMLVVDNAAEANDALALVHNYSEQCFIGRSNTFTGNDHYGHIVEYWQGTGMAGATLPTTDCISYDNTSLSVNNLGASGYQVVAGSDALLLTGNSNDANAAVALAKKHHQLCFIGRGNPRPLPKEYIVEYWN